MKENIFREYDIRGVYPEELNEQVAYSIATAFSEYIKENIKKEKNELYLSIGMDIRKSSPKIKDALIKGFTDNGINVVDLGLCPTPVLYFSLFTPLLEQIFVDAAVMITASHNPPQFNGLKLCLNKATLYGPQIKEIFNIAKNSKEVKNNKKGKILKYDLISNYVSFMVGQFMHLRNYFCKLDMPMFAVDCGNGTAGPTVERILNLIGIKYLPLFFEPDGNFPNHHPDPTVPNNIKKLISVVKKKKLLCGIGYDGDSDRIGAVGSDGNIIFGDKLLLLYAKYLLKKYPGAKVIGEVKCSQTLFDGIEKFGGKPIIYKAGHSLIKKKMKQENALLAGEMSGHIFFSDRYFGFDDAIYASLRLLEIISEENKQLDKIISFIPKTFVTPEIRVDCPDEKKFDVVKNISQEVKRLGLKYLDIDGVRIIFDDGGFGLVRASNTQPVLVLRFEARNNKLLEEHKKFLFNLVEKYSK